MKIEALDIDDFPEVPLDKRPCELPHSGSFSKEQLKELEKRGWTPVDIRFANGVRKIQLTLEAAIRGTVLLDRQQSAALKLASQIYLDKRTSEAESRAQFKKDKNVNQDPIELIANLGWRPHSRDLDNFPEVKRAEVVGSSAEGAGEGVFASHGGVEASGVAPAQGSEAVTSAEQAMNAGAAKVRKAIAMRRNASIEKLEKHMEALDAKKETQ